MATAYKQKDGTWRGHADTRSIDGKQPSQTGFQTKAEATHWAQEVEVKARARGAARTIERGMFGPFAKGVILYRGDVAVTLDRYETMLRLQIMPRWETTFLDEIAADDVEAWLMKMRREDELASSTIKGVFRLFRQIIKRAVARGLIKNDPTLGDNGKPHPLPTGGQRVAHVVPMSVAEHLADAIDPRFRAAVLVMAYGGLRICEALALRQIDLDVEGNVVRVENTQRRAVGGVALSKPKTKKSQRTVVVPRSVMEALVATWRLRPETEWVFPTERGTMIRYDSFMTGFWYPACARISLDDFRPHDLRHSHATDLIDQGEHVKIISMRLGHSSIAITMDLYGHRIHGQDAGLAARLEERRRAMQPATVLHIAR